MNPLIKISFLISIIFQFSATYTQITHGTILYERKTNLLKKFKDPKQQKWLRGEKMKVDRFNLYFTPKKSLFLPDENAIPTKADWATSKNIVIQDLKKKERISIYNLFGEKKTVKDDLIERKWKITERKRNIAGYSCRRAIWLKNDSTRIYAWYTDQIIPPTGPETFNGLPGTILGLATEDGGVVYFAKKVEDKNPEINELISKVKIKKTYTEYELRQELLEKSKSNPWMGKIMNYLFEW